MVEERPCIERQELDRRRAEIPELVGRDIEEGVAQRRHQVARGGGEQDDGEEKESGRGAE